MFPLHRNLGRHWLVLRLSKGLFKGLSKELNKKSCYTIFIFVVCLFSTACKEAQEVKPHALVTPELSMGPLVDTASVINKIPDVSLTSAQIISLYEESSHHQSTQQDISLSVSPSLASPPVVIETSNVAVPTNIGLENQTRVMGINQRPQIAIIMDDLGYQRSQSNELLAIGQPISYAVIPNTPFAKVIAADIVSANQELMLHIPMQTISERKWERGLTENMTAMEFNAEINTMLNDYPHAKGINNHGGSLLTQNIEKMQWLMASLQPRGLYFVDSRTTSASVARKVAIEQHVQSFSRDVFLDNDKNIDAIAKKFEHVKRLATKNGHAIAIGHPHRSTIDFLVNSLSEAEAQGFDLVFVSDLLVVHRKVDQSEKTVLRESDIDEIKESVN